LRYGKWWWRMITSAGKNNKLKDCQRSTDIGENGGQHVLFVQ
jgi:general stress protein YciG